MHTPISLNSLAGELLRLNPFLSSDEAGMAASYIGDTPLLNDSNQVLWLHDDGTEVWLNWEDNDGQSLGALTFTPDAVLITMGETRHRLTWDAGRRLAVVDGVAVENVLVNEIAARHFLWTHDLLPDSVAESPRVLGEADAAAALANHLRAMDEAKL